jgi:hypothetical protein
MIGHKKLDIKHDQMPSRFNALMHDEVKILRSSCGCSDYFHRGGINNPKHWLESPSKYQVELTITSEYHLYLILALN